MIHSCVSIPNDSFPCQPTILPNIVFQLIQNMQISTVVNHKRTLTHTCTKQSKIKAYGSDVKNSYCRPAGQFKFHGERLQNLMFHNDPSTTEQVKDSWTFASPVYTRYPLILQLGGLLPQLTPGYQVPI